MGIPKSSALEAAKVLDNANDVVEITKYIFKDPKDKIKLYEKRTKEARSMFVFGHGDLIGELKLLERQLATERRKGCDLENQNKSKTESYRLDFYQEFLRALVADETLNVEHLSAWREYKSSKEITNVEHKHILEKLTCSVDDWKLMVEG